jgi:hypothetical protein
MCKIELRDFICAPKRKEKKKGSFANITGANWRGSPNHKEPPH